MFLELQMFRDCNDLLWESVSESECACKLVCVCVLWVSVRVCLCEYVCLCVSVCVLCFMDIYVCVCEDEKWCEKCLENEGMTPLAIDSSPTSCNQFEVCMCVCVLFCFQSWCRSLIKENVSDTFIHFSFIALFHLLIGKFGIEYPYDFVQTRKSLIRVSDWIHILHS